MSMSNVALFLIHIRICMARLNTCTLLHATVLYRLLDKTPKNDKLVKDHGTCNLFILIGLPSKMMYHRF